MNTQYVASAQPRPGPAQLARGGKVSPLRRHREDCMSSGRASIEALKTDDAALGQSWFDSETTSYRGSRTVDSR